MKDGSIWIKLGIDEESFRAKLEEAKGTVKNFGESVSSTGKTLEDLLKVPEKELGKYGDQIAALGGDIAKAMSGITPLANEVNDTIIRLQEEYRKLGHEASEAFMSGNDDRYRNLKALQDELGGVMDVYAKLNGAIGESTEKLAQQGEAVEDLAGKSAAMSELESAVGKADGSVNSLLNSVRGISGVFRGTTNPIQAFRMLITAAKSAMNLAKISVDALKTSLKALSKSFAPLLAITAVVAVIALLKKKFDEQKKAAEEAAKAQEEFNNSVAESAAKPIVAFKKLQTEWESLGNNLKAKQKFVADNRKEFNNLGVAVNDVAEAERLFTEQADAFVEAQRKKAVATAYYAVAAKEAEKLIELQQKRDEYVNSQYDELTMPDGSTQKVQRTTLRNVAPGVNIQEAFDPATDYVAQQFEQEINEQNEKIKKIIKQGVDEDTDAAKMMAAAGIRSATDSTVSEIEKQQKRLSEAYAKALEEYNKNKAKAEQKARFDTRQITIDGMADGLEKTLEQLKLNHDREMAQIRQQEEEKIEQWRQLKEKEWAAQNPQADAEKNPYGKKKLYDKNGAFMRSSLSETDAADLANDLAVFTTMRENENEKWKQNESDAMRDVLASVRTMSRRVLSWNYQSDRAALVAKGASDEQLALFDSQHEAEQKKLFADLLGDYVGFQQQLTDAAEEYNAKRAELEAAAKAETDPKRKAALQDSLKELKKQYGQTVKDIQQEFIKNNIGDVFNEQTVENIKEAKRALDEMEAMSLEEFNLAYQAHLTADEFDSLKQRIREVRNELREMGKGYTIKDALDDAFGKGKGKEDRERGISALIGGLNTAADLTGKMADAMKTFADASGNVELQKIADTFSYVSNTLSSVAGYAAAGSVFGPVGAAVGAGVGLLTGIANAIIGSKQEEAAKEQERLQKANEYTDKFLSAVGQFLSATETFGDAVNAMNFDQYRQSLLSLIEELKNLGSNYTGEYWSSLNALANSWDILNNGVLDDRNLVDLASKLLIFDGSDSIKGIVSDYLNGAIDSLTDAQRELITEYLKGLQQRNQTIVTNGKEKTVRQYIKEQYANQYNYRALELDEKRKALLDEINKMYEEGNINTLDYFNKLRQVYALELEMLQLQKEELQGQDQSEDTQNRINEIENQIAELRLRMQESFEELFEGISGEDVQGIVNKWLDIFKEFGDDVSGAIGKINESIDDMIKNFIYQTMFVGPIVQRMKEELAEISPGEDGLYSTEQMFEAFGKLQGLVGEAGIQWQDLLGKLREMGYEVESANERSASARGIATASQDSVDELNGRATTIQGHTFNISENSNIIRDNTNAILSSVLQIENNTQHLVRMDNDLHHLHIAISDIQTQGVRLRNN